LGTGGMGIEESLHKELQNKTLFQTIFWRHMHAFFPAHTFLRLLYLQKPGKK
jgi:hypothetical protein